MPQSRPSRHISLLGPSREESKREVLEGCSRGGGRVLAKALLETVHKLGIGEDIPETAVHVVEAFGEINLGLNLLDSCSFTE